MSTLSGGHGVPSSQEDTTDFSITVDLRLTLDEATTSDPPTTSATPRAITFKSDSYRLEPSGDKPTEWKITHQDSSMTSGTPPGTNIDPSLYGRQSPLRQSGQFANDLPSTI